MKIVGLTGGIGSGKTTVAEFFSQLGVPIYIADDAGKYVLRTSKVVRRKMIKLLGKNCYIDGKPNKSFIADIIFNDIEKLAAVNEIIHPKVVQHFKKWLKKQSAIYCIKEAAILFENGGYLKCDYNILVTAPIGTRIKRVQERDSATKAQILSRMRNQWPDEDKIPLASYVINNIDLNETNAQVKILHQQLCELSL